MEKNQEALQIVENTEQNLLHPSICSVVFSNANRMRSFGSGALISRDLVLTAASNVFQKMQGSDFRDFKVYLGLNGIANQYYEVETIRYLEQYKSCERSKDVSYNFALLKLKKLVQHNEFLKVSIGCPQCLIEKNHQNILSLYGFPMFRDNYQPLDARGDQFRLNQYGLSRKNRIAKIDPSLNIICYKMTTMPGQGGSPVVVNQAIVGIHLGKEKNGEKFGRIIDQALLNKLNQWCQELKANRFIQKKLLCSHTHHQNSSQLFEPKKTQIQSQPPIVPPAQAQQGIFTSMFNVFKNMFGKK